MGGLVGESRKNRTVHEPAGLGLGFIMSFVLGGHGDLVTA